jgi:hypothetical protein
MRRPVSTLSCDEALMGAVSDGVVGVVSVSCWPSTRASDMGALPPTAGNTKDDQ